MKSHSSRNQTLEKLRIQTKVYQEELDNGIHLMESVQKKKQHLLSEMDKELAHQKDLREKINYLKDQYKVLQAAFKANQNILDQTIEDRVELQSEVKRIETTVKSILTRKTNDSAINNNYPMLMQKINEGSAFPKEKSVLLNAIKVLIGTTKANEFSDFKWKAKVSKSNKAIGARIRFTKLAILQSDMKELYGPVIEKLGASFKRSGISIQTKTKKCNNIVSELDITIKVPFKIIEKRLELP